MRFIPLLLVLLSSRYAQAQYFNPYQGPAGRNNPALNYELYRQQQQAAQCQYQWVSVFNPNTGSYTQVYVCK